MMKFNLKPTKDLLVKKLIIPINLDVENDVIGYKKNWHFKYLYIVNAIFEVGNLSHKDFVTWCNLSSKLLKFIVGNDYRHIIKQLIDSKIIEESKPYWSGSINRSPYCKSYRLTEKYSFQRVKMVELNDRIIFNKINIQRKKNLNNLLKKRRLNKVLYKYLTNIKIDYNGAMDFINYWYEHMLELKQLDISNIKNMRTDSEKIDEAKRIDKKYKNLLYVQQCMVGSVQRIEDKDFTFVKDEFGHRLHTNLTNLKSILRPFIKFDNQQLYAIDIANSQPYLFNILINEYIKKNDYPVTHDIELYRKLTSSGMLYKFLGEKFGYTEDELIEFKKRFFGTVFFTDTKNNGKRPYEYREKRIFRENFPHVLTIINFYKIGNFKKLCEKLQREESSLILDTIGRLIIKKYPDKFFLTIHDSIVCLKEDVANFKEIMEDEILKKVGIMPLLRVECYDEQYIQKLLKDADWMLETENIEEETIEN